MNNLFQKHSLWRNGASFCLLLVGSILITEGTVSSAFLKDTLIRIERPQKPSLETSPAVSLNPWIESVELSTSQVIDFTFSALHFEHHTDAWLARFKAQTETYVKYRRGKLPLLERRALISECSTRTSENPYCSLIANYGIEKWKDGRFPNNKTITTKPKIRSLASAALEGNISAFDNATEGQIYRALTKLDDWLRVEPLATKASRMWSCPRPELLTALAMKAEEFFPEESFKHIAMGLYDRAASCGDEDNGAAIKARYRLSLLHIWDGNCKKADPHLIKLVENGAPEMKTRALYWQGRCAKDAGNALLVKLLQTRIMKSNPIGFHSLSLNYGESFQVSSLIQGDDPKIQIRTQVAEELNSMARMVEALIQMNEREYAREILYSMDRRIEGVEPAFRMYLGILAYRIEQRLLQFKLMSEAFRDDPRLISKSSMEIFYPLVSMKLVQSRRHKIDPYLAIALIRQESAFNPKARSHAGALGLMQLMPNTAQKIARVNKSQIMSPETNVRLGTEYLNRLKERYEGIVEYVLAAYNAGPERVDNWRRRYPTSDLMLFVELIPFSETRNYVSLIGRNYYWYLTLYAPERLEPPLDRTLASLSSSEPRVSIFSAFN